MPRVLITGMSGAGKSTVLAELCRRGHVTVDTDYGDWTRPDGKWDETRLAALLEGNRDIAISGTVENQGDFYDRFEHVVLLSAPLDVLLDRAGNRCTNPYGSTQTQQLEIAHNFESVEPLLRRGATLEIDGQLPPADIADVVERLITPAP